MSLDGLRAWIGEVERKLGMRTRVFLVLVAIAVGGAGASIYLAVEAQNDAVTKGDLQAVQAELQGKIEALEANSAEGTGAVGAAGVAALTLEVRQLQAKVEKLEGTPGSGSEPQGAGKKPKQ